MDRDSGESSYDRESDGEVVAVDEADFFTEELVDLCEFPAADGLRVIVSGVDKRSAPSPRPETGDSSAGSPPT